MAEFFKDIYNEAFFDDFADNLKIVIEDFDKNNFLSKIMDENWVNKELKQRVRHISKVLREILPNSYEQSVSIIVELLKLSRKNQMDLSLEYLFFPDFIEQYGLESYDASIQAIEQITQFISCEFSVRPFIVKYPNEMMEQMLTWSLHSHYKVRRLASEGSRPRLPWAMALPKLKDNPQPIFQILNNLKNDESDFVRRSVANNLNDISKDSPEAVIQIANRWKGESEYTDWIIKHGCRTLLKQGNLEVMRLFGFGSIDEIEVHNFSVLTPKIKIGQVLEFEFQLENKHNTKTKIRLEYGIYYQKSNGSLSKKVFKISEKYYAGNSSTNIIRKQSFKVITTRKFYCGIHQVSLIVNGREVQNKDFELIL